jgi:hypothetical protein
MMRSESPLALVPAPPKKLTQTGLTCSASPLSYYSGSKQLCWHRGPFCANVTAQEATSAHP